MPKLIIDDDGIVETRRTENDKVLPRVKMESDLVRCKCDGVFMRYQHYKHIKSHKHKRYEKLKAEILKKENIIIIK